MVDEITKRNGRAIAIQGDVARPDDIERMFAETHRAWGQLDIGSDLIQGLIRANPTGSRRST